MENKFRWDKTPKKNLSDYKSDIKVLVNSKDGVVGKELKIGKLIIQACEILTKNTNPYDADVMASKAVLNQAFEEIIPSRYEKDISGDLAMFSAVRKIGLSEAARIEVFDIVRGERAKAQAKGASGSRQKLTRRDVAVKFHSETGFVGMDYRDMLDDPYGEYEKLGQELATQIRNNVVAGAEQSLLNGMLAAFTAGKVSAIYINGLTKIATDFAINEIRSLGSGVKIVGGYLPLSVISEFPTNSTSAITVSERNLIAVEDNGHVGHYNGSVLYAYTSPFKYGVTQTTTVDTVDYKVWDKQLTENSVYIMPTSGAVVPNYTFLRGGITTMMGYDLENAEEMVRADQIVGYHFEADRSENIAIIRDDNTPA